MVGRRTLNSAVLSLGLVLGTAACGGGALDPTPDAAATTTTAEETTSSPAETSTGEATVSASSSPDGQLDEDDEGRKLTLADFFNAGSQWEENRYDIADQKDVLGIATTVQYCGDDYTPQELELRLGNNFDELTFSAAQANNSQKSDQSLTVEVLANNEQAEIFSVPFNEVQEFTIDVEGVNALKIRLYLDDSNPDCEGTVVGVITGTTLN
jgi:hypothetical protein